MDKSEYPRERLIKYGVSHLTIKELIAVIIGRGVKEENVFSLSEKIKDMLLSSYYQEDFNYSKIMSIKGVKLAKACQILASIELGKRMITRSISHTKLKTPKDVYDNYFARLHGLTQEHVIAVYLNKSRCVLNDDTLFIGSENNVSIDEKVIFRKYYQYSADYVILVHNHPSGDSTPSLMDIESTNNIISMGSIIGVFIYDHIIIGNKECSSIMKSQKYVME